MKLDMSLNLEPIYQSSALVIFALLPKLQLIELLVIGKDKIVTKIALQSDNDITILSCFINCLNQAIKN